MKRFLILLTFSIVSLWLTQNVLAVTDQEKHYLSFGYALINFTPNKKLDGYFGKDSQRSLNGFFAEYSYSFHGARTLPLYGEVGANLQMGFYSKEKNISSSLYKSIYKTQLMAVSLPISAGWRFKLSDSFSLQPFLGIDPKFNVMIRSKSTYNKAYFNAYKNWGIKESDDAYQWKNHLSDDKKTGMGSSENVWESIQFGWHIGLSGIYGKAKYSVRYGSDFIPAYSHGKKRINSSSLFVGIGFLF